MREMRQAGAGLGPRLTTGLVLLGLVMVSVNLRPAITTVAGVMNQVPGVFGLDPSLLPLLGTLPVLAFGVSGPIGPWLARRWGTGRAVAVALVVLAAALTVRATVPALLLPGTFLAGMAIMTASVLVPQIVKANRGTGWWTGLCTMGFGLGAALGAGLVQPLQHAPRRQPAMGLGRMGAACPGRRQPHSPIRRYPLERRRSDERWRRVVVGRHQQSRHQRTWPREVGHPAAKAAHCVGSDRVLRPSSHALLRHHVVAGSVFGIPGARASRIGGPLAWFSLAGLPASLLAPVLAGRPGILKSWHRGLAYRWRSRCWESWRPRLRCSS